MPVNDGMFSSATHEWETPGWLFDHFSRVFNITLDVCATKENAKCCWFYDKKDDGLTKEWDFRNWMNPPYGREIGKWVKKAYEESLKGNLTVCLLPARTDTKWFQDYVMKADSIHFIRGRLKFGGQTNSAPFPSVIVIFGLYNYRRQ